LIFYSDITHYKFSFTKKSIIKLRSFFRQVNFHIAQLPENQHGAFELLLKKISIIVFCMSTVFILGCYASEVPLSSKINFGTSIVGKWKSCTDEGKGFFEIKKINDIDYLWIDHRENGEAYPSIVFFSEINGIKFLNISNSDADKKPVYSFLRIEMGENTITMQPVGDYLFKKGKLQFDDPEKLTSYFKKVMKSDYFYSSWEDGNKIVTEKIIEKCRIR